MCTEKKLKVETRQRERKNEEKNSKITKKGRKQGKEKEKQGTEEEKEEMKIGDINAIGEDKRRRWGGRGAALGMN